eukprot:scaffold20086_cov157-Isochrysis_galbana.AAC.1
MGPSLAALSCADVEHNLAHVRVGLHVVVRGLCAVEPGHLPVDGELQAARPTEARQHLPGKAAHQLRLVG